MICLKCNTDNNISVKYCKSCGNEFKSTNIPLSGGERVSIVVYFLILVATSFAISGAIPLIVSFVTLYIISTNKNFHSIGTSYMIIVVACIIASIGWGLAAMDYSAHTRPGFIPFVLGSLILIVISKKLFFDILETHEQWIIENGLFADTPKESKKPSNIIIGRDNLSTFSVADELLKWNVLLEKGLISKEEFESSKQKLLEQRDL